MKLHIVYMIIGIDTSQNKLKVFLLVPNFSKNILSISQLTSDYPYLCKFYDFGFFIEEKMTNHTILNRQQRVFYMLCPLLLKLISPLSFDLLLNKCDINSWDIHKLLRFEFFTPKGFFKFLIRIKGSPYVKVVSTR